jgi:hypothetical protein
MFTGIPVAAIAAGIVVVIILIILAIWIIKSCLPKILIGLIILGIVGYFAYRYFTS